MNKTWSSTYIIITFGWPWQRRFATKSACLACCVWRLNDATSGAVGSWKLTIIKNPFKIARQTGNTDYTGFAAASHADVLRLVTRWNAWQAREARQKRVGLVGERPLRPGLQTSHILHAPNRIAELNACKRRHLNQFNATYFNSMRVQSNIRLKFDSWFISAAFYMCRIIW